MEQSRTPQSLLRAFRFPDRLLASLFVLTALVALLAWPRLSSFDRYTVALRNARGMPLRVVVFEPRYVQGERRPRPAVLVCQPVNSPPEAGLALILEFVRRGMLVVTFDFRGAGPGENRSLLRENLLAITAQDAATALEYLARRPDVDRDRIGLIGHSVGGTLALRAGIEQPWVRATVAVGIAGDVTKTRPQNLLWLVGLYDEFRPLSEMQRVMELSNNDGVAEIERTTGDFGQGTARRLSVTSTADHFTEFSNHGAAVRALEWFQSSFEGRPAPRPRLAVAPWFYACYSLAFLFGWLLLVRRLRPTRPRLFTAAIAALEVALLLVPMPKLALFRADLALWSLALLLVVNARQRGDSARSSTQQSPGCEASGTARLVALIALGWLSLLITLVVNQVAYFWRYPHLLAGLPAFPFWHATGLLNSVRLSARAAVFQLYRSHVAPRLALLGTLGHGGGSTGHGVRWAVDPSAALRSPARQDCRSAAKEMGGLAVGTGPVRRPWDNCFHPRGAGLRKPRIAPAGRLGHPPLCRAALFHLRPPETPLAMERGGVRDIG